MENTLVLSISYGVGCYRHIKISSSATLHDLHEYILDIFDFCDDHLHVFFMNNRAWDSAEGYYSPKYEEDAKYTTDYKLSDFNLEKGSKFLYIFDFGEEHKFSVKVLRTEEDAVEEPKLIKSVGESPVQYLEYKDEDYEEEYDERDQMILDYADAAANLYGAISLEEFFEIYKSQTDDTIDKSDLEKLDDGGAYNFWKLYNGYIVNVMFEEEAYKEIPKFLENMKNKPRYIPSPSEFVKYAELLYTDEPVHQAKMRLFLEKEFGKTEDVLNLYVDICSLCKSEAEFESIMDVFEEYKFEFKSDDDLKKFVTVLNELMNNTRLWSNKGYTAEQMVAMYRSKPARTNKIGRNEPCPCGSGKKYKKCCGR